MPSTTDDLSDLLESWETAYKRGLLTFWLLMLLAERPAYAYEISSALHHVSHETVTVNEQSIYRALTRFESLGLVTSVVGPSKIGPPRKYYHLSSKGRLLLSRFIQRNLMIFLEPDLTRRLQELTGVASTEDETP